MLLLSRGEHEKAREVRLIMQALSRWRDALVTRRLSEDARVLAELTEALDRCTEALSLYTREKTGADQAFNNLIRLVAPVLDALDKLPG